jgi:hypothetical protein
MQTPDLKGMGDPGQILDRPFTNVEKATILAVRPPSFTDRAPSS